MNYFKILFKINNYMKFVELWFVNRPVFYSRIFRKGLLIFLVFYLAGCVPARKYEDLLERRQETEDRNTEIRKQNEQLSTDLNELTNENETLSRELNKLRQDTTQIGHKWRELQRKHVNLQRTYEILTDQNEKLLEGKDEETRQILSELQKTQEGLLEREDQLRRTTREMAQKEERLDQLNERLQKYAEELNQKNIRVNELENILARQDSTVQALKSKVSAALLGFEGEGLTVNVRNGKVYVSLEESLLFATGSTRVDSKGVSALKELAKVLENNPNINVLIEGHTDDVPFRPGSQIKDNWDLSVLRATSIVRIILGNSDADPHRFTVAGRGEFLPVDDAKTPEARMKNRRTEIILTPKLDDLFQIIEMN
jgi:chemotaxis protein MotB